MITRKFKEHASKKIFRIILGTIVYLTFAFYAVPVFHMIPSVYHNAYAFVSEKFLSNKKNIIIGNTSLLVDVADTQDKRVKGLSGVAQLPVRSGMLFVFDTPDLYGFWMKDMNFAIDIIWFNKYGEIIYFVQEVGPDSYPETFLPPQDSLYVLEVSAGFVKKEGLKIGDKIDLY